MEERRSKGSSTPDDFNWLGLAYSAASNAFEAADKGCKDEALAWADVAIKAYEHLISVNVHGVSELERSAMFVRARMIGIFGTISGHPILDPAVVEQWFLDRLPVSLDEATTMTSDWKERPIAEIRELREIKNRLAVIQSFMDDGHLTDSAILRQWLMMHERLP
jgi:hypothetical protein